MNNKSDIKLFFSLFGWALVPSIYLLVKMHIIAFNNVDINILGQLEWFDLIDETIVTVLTVPLYYLLKPEKTNINKNGSVFCISFLVYMIFTMIVVYNISKITTFMNSANSIQYLSLEAVSLLIGFISSFMIIILTLNSEYKLIRFAMILKILCLIVLDYIFIRLYKENGSALSEIIVNVVMGIILLILVKRKGYISFKKFELIDFREWFRIGSFSGMQILLDNIIYALIVCKMVNAVNESGNYWVANNFIWGWLLVPVTCLGEVIRKNNIKKLTFKNSFMWGLIILGFWVITLPVWNIFVRRGMMIEENGIMNIVYLVMPFYIFYIPSVIFDSYFISKGKTYCNFIISVVVNILYYGIMYMLFRMNLFKLNISFIIMLFGFGMVVHIIIDIALYILIVMKSTNSINN